MTFTAFAHNVVDKVIGFLIYKPCSPAFHDCLIEQYAKHDALTRLRRANYLGVVFSKQFVGHIDASAGVVQT